MTSETPDPSRPDAAAPKPPRILVSVGDLEDPADWDVIVVENDAIDDATALRIARERTGHVGASVPSLDEEDVNRAFYPVDDADAEGTDAVTSDAFAPPELPSRRAPRPDAPPPMLDDGFGHLPGADDLVDDEELPAGDGLPIDSTEVQEDGHLPAAPAHPWAATDDAAMAEQPEAVFDPIGAEEDSDPEVEAEEPEAVSTVEVDALPQRPLLDDPGDDFYGIGDAEAELDDAPLVETAFAADLADEHEGEGTRDLLDDPGDDFYDIGPGPVAPLAAVPWGAPSEAPVARIGLDLWGSPTGEELEPGLRPLDSLTVAAAAAAARAASVAEVPDEPVEAEDDHTFDSAFPLGPDDLLSPKDDDGATIEVDALDYANVFGPVAGTRANLPDLVPVRTRRAESDAAMGLYDYDDTYVGAAAPGDVVEEDEDWVVPAAAGGDGPRRGRRRELAVLALAGLVVAGIGLANQLLSSGEDPLVSGPESTSSSSSSSTVVRRSSASTLPTIPSPDSSVPVEGEVDDGGGQTTDTTRRRNTSTTTTKKPVGSSSTTVQQTTTTTQATTTTTQATTTTTQATTTTNTDGMA